MEKEPSSVSALNWMWNLFKGFHIYLSASLPPSPSIWNPLSWCSFVHLLLFFTPDKCRLKEFGQQSSGNKWPCHPVVHNLPTLIYLQTPNYEDKCKSSATAVLQLQKTIIMNNPIYTYIKSREVLLGIQITENWGHTLGTYSLYCPHSL